MPGSVPLSASASAMSVPMPDSSAPLSLCLWLCLGHPLFCVCLLYAWIRSSVCVCVCCMSVLIPDLLAPLSASDISLVLPKALKKELINVAFLDSLGNHV